MIHAMTSPSNTRPLGLHFFPGNHPALADQLTRFLDDCGRRLEREGRALGATALILAGGYGRGEGGVFVEGQDHRLYNDVEFYLFSRGRPSSKLRKWIRQTEITGEKSLGVHVEIKALPESWLEQPGTSMFLYDLVKGHVVVHGPQDFLGGDRLARFGDPARIPLHEATRLLFNRGSGLLFSAAKLAGVDPEFDAGFIQRNHAKARLALGDAVLSANGLYRSSCRERERLMTTPFPHKPPCWNAVRQIHSAGVLFKLNPRHESLPREEMERQQKDLVELWSCVFLWIEGRRLGRIFASLKEYAKCRARLLPEFPAWKNIAIRLRDRARHGESLGRASEYPRGVLQKALAALLSGPGTAPNLAAGARILGVAEAEAFETYRRWWQRYN